LPKPLPNLAAAVGAEMPASTRGFRGQRGAIGPRAGAGFFGGDSGDGKRARLESGDEVLWAKKAVPKVD